MLRIAPKTPPPPTETEEAATTIEAMPEATDVTPADDDMPMASVGTVDPSVARYFGPESICDVCIHFDGTSACEIVAGPIDPDGRCSLFTPDAEPLSAEPTEMVEESPDGNTDQPIGSSK